MRHDEPQHDRHNDPSPRRIEEMAALARDEPLIDMLRQVYAAGFTDGRQSVERGRLN